MTGFDDFYAVAAKRAAALQVGVGTTAGKAAKAGATTDRYYPPSPPLSVARSFNDLPEPRRPLRTVIGLPERLCGRLLTRYLALIVDRRERDAARTDPAWAALMARLNTPGADGFLHGDDEIAKHSEIYDRVHVGWPFQAERWLDKHSLLRRYDRLAGMVQRGKRGWADEDLWGFDYYLAGVIAGAVRQIADLSFGWSDRLWPTHEEWVAELRKLADNLDQLVVHYDEDNYDEAEALCDEILAVLRKAYGHLRID
jgi:hypothetical protein